MRNNNITNKAFYKMLKTFIEVNGYIPSVREIGAYIGLNSPSSVQYHLYKLEKLGKIKIVNVKRIEFLED